MTGKFINSFDRNMLNILLWNINDYKMQLCLFYNIVLYNFVIILRLFKDE